MDTTKEVIDFIKGLYGSGGMVPLHVPVFIGNEKSYLAECIDSTFVSYIGEFVTRLEKTTAEYTGTSHAVATTSGTTALQTALVICGVKPGDLVITQSLTFVGTVNPIAHCGAAPVFVDVDMDSMGMSPESLKNFLTNSTKMDSEGNCVEKSSGKHIAACVPVHIFGNPCRIDEIAEICRQYGITLIEDAAESLGSYYKGKHTGSFGKVGILSYNGNKIVTTGGGGMIITSDEELDKRARKITTTAKKPHPYEFFHDETAFNYRMPNVNAAVGCAQMESLEFFLKNKADTANLYKKFFAEKNITFINPVENGISNNWLNAILLENRAERDAFLKETNANGVMTRPAWTLMHKLPMYENSIKTDLSNSIIFEDRAVCLPSSVRL